jgi:hypothetical protein
MFDGFLVSMCKEIHEKEEADGLGYDQFKESHR